jgi:hypothetical protein
VSGPPPLDAGCFAPEHRAAAARTWRDLLAQEERSRLATGRLVRDLARIGAPATVLRAAERVARDEARHVEICAHVVSALGSEAVLPIVELAPLPADASAFEQAVVELLVAGFAVAETMSVGGFAAMRAVATEPLARWAVTEILRDEVRHGGFGELASAWALRGWSEERRRTLWPACVRAMEQVHGRIGDARGAARPVAGPIAELGGAPQAVVGAGLLRAVPRFVVPRLARLGVLPDRAGGGP